MPRRSITIGLQRPTALRRPCCAPIAYALLFFAAPLMASAQSPTLQGPASAPPPVAPPATSPAPTELKPAVAPLVRPALEKTQPAASDSKLPLPPQPATASQANDSKPAKPTEDLAVALNKTGDLKLNGLKLDDALFVISEQWNINIVAGDVKGTVNGVFKQAPLHEILDAILLSNGYNYRIVGKSLVISSIEQLGQVNPAFQSAIIPVQNADIDEVVNGAQLLKTPKGEVKPLKSAHSIVVLDFPDRVKMIREFVDRIDNAGSGGGENRNGAMLDVGYFRTQYITAKTAEQAILPIMSKAGKCSVLEKEDRLLVTDYHDNLQMIEKVLASVDRPRPQVRITALIYNIGLEDVEKLGINWNDAFHGRPDANGVAQNKFGVDSLMQVPFQQGAAGSSLTFMSLNKHFDITAVVQALQQANDARLLADPNVAVLENEEAVFKQVSEIPYQQLTQTAQGGQIGTTSFREAGVTLFVTPKIAAEGIIRMTVKPEVSRLTGFTPGDNQPIIDTNSAQTVLNVANRQTVVIGGLRQRSDVGNTNGVPYLKDLNVVGRLFRARDTDVKETELVVFLSPEIISYSDEPTCRQKLCEDTIHCRLDQLPQAEGCPPCCRRLPGEANDPYLPPASGANEPVPADPNSPAAHEELPPIGPQAVPNDSAKWKLPNGGIPILTNRVPTYDPLLGPGAPNAEAHTTTADSPVRRLPKVSPATTTIETTAAVGQKIFDAPPAATQKLATPDSEPARTAEKDETYDCLRR